MSIRLAKEAVVAVIGVAATYLAAHCSQGCYMFASQEAIDSAYQVELAKCVKDSPTLEASKACRSGVNERYRVCADPQWPGRLQPCP